MLINIEDAVVYKMHRVRSESEVQAVTKLMALVLCNSELRTVLRSGESLVSRDGPFWPL